LANASEDQPPPCICKCGGKIQCEKGQWAFCECSDGKCEAKCSTEKHEPLELAADVTSAIVLKPVTVGDLKREAPCQYTISRQLLSGRLSDGRYFLFYEGRGMGFSFTTGAVNLLTRAVSQLRELEH
jgi:hypothetical protein